MLKENVKKGNECVPGRENERRGVVVQAMLILMLVPRWWTHRRAKMSTLLRLLGAGLNRSLDVDRRAQTQLLHDGVSLRAEAAARSSGREGQSSHRRCGDG
jgi:hypothetical protein